jgi:putative two-component system response regulator
MPGVKGIEVLRSIKSQSPTTEVIIITGFATVDNAVEGIRYGIHDFISKPFNVVEVVSTIERALRKRRSLTRLHQFLERLAHLMGRDTPSQRVLENIETDDAMLVEVRHAIEEAFLPVSATSQARLLEFAEVLADTLESKDLYTHGHSRRVSYYAGLLAERVGLPPAVRENIRLAAFLHDIGKIGVSNRLILKDGRLREEERSVLAKHPEIGESLLEPLALPPGVLQGVRHHHEHYDGNGYPDHLGGEEIPIEARVILIADAYDAMASDRPYRKGLPRSLITREFSKYAGAQFDPQLTAAFLDLLEHQEELFLDVL